MRDLIDRPLQDEKMTVPDQVKYLYSIRSVRETNADTAARIRENKLSNFNVNLEKMDGVVDFVCGVIRETYPSNESLGEIPVHGRFQHFNSGDPCRLQNVLDGMKESCDDYELCKRLVDLFVISVLLDAGAGNQWKFTEPNGRLTGRSEGIAIASLYMYTSGVFSEKAGGPLVNGSKLATLTEEELLLGLQVTPENPMTGVQGRLHLLNKLGETLQAKRGLFPDERPGDLVDHFKASAEDGVLDLEVIWDALMELLLPVWPTQGRVQLDGYVLGDAWPLRSKDGGIVTFHKLTQWLAYSLLKPLQDYGGFRVKNVQLLTGLPEYRNGGLFVDLGVLELKPEVYAAGMATALKNGLSVAAYRPEEDVIVEWRSCTICLLDMLLPAVNSQMGITGTKYELTLPQLIEAGSWKSGRAAASARRVHGGPPIELLADGTVF